MKPIANRTRLLVIAKEQAVRNDLITLLTGYGYYVDYVQNLSEGIDMFRRHKHAVVILDVPALPGHPQRMFRIFRSLQRNPIVVIAARADEEEKVYPYLKLDVYDIIQLPLRVAYLDFSLRRLVEHGRVVAEGEFHRIVCSLAVLTAPLWIVLTVALALAR